MNGHWEGLLPTGLKAVALNPNILPDLFLSNKACWTKVVHKRVFKVCLDLTNNCMRNAFLRSKKTL